jgi:hypothetical protein
MSRRIRGIVSMLSRSLIVFNAINIALSISNIASTAYRLFITNVTWHHVLDIEKILCADIKRLYVSGLRSEKRGKGGTLLTLTILTGLISILSFVWPLRNGGSSSTNSISMSSSRNEYVQYLGSSATCSQTRPHSGNKRYNMGGGQAKDSGVNSSRNSTLHQVTVWQKLKSLTNTESFIVVKTRSYKKDTFLPCAATNNITCFSVCARVFQLVCDKTTHLDKTILIYCIPESSPSWGNTPVSSSKSG